MSEEEAKAEIKILEAKAKDLYWLFTRSSSSKRSGSYLNEMLQVQNKITELKRLHM